MRSAEIKRKFEEIVAFAGIDELIDTPAKRCSSEDASAAGLRRGRPILKPRFS